MHVSTDRPRSGAHAASSPGLLAGLGRGVGRHPLVVLVVWVLLSATGFAAASGVLGEGLFDRIASEDPDVPGESRQGRELLVDSDRGGPSVQLAVRGVDLADEDLVARLYPAREQLRSIAWVEGVADPYAFPSPDAPDPTDPRAGALVSSDRDGFLVSVSLVPDLTAEQEDSSLAAVRSRLRQLGEEIRVVEPDAEVAIGGLSELVDAINAQVEEDLQSGESIALPISLLVMVVVFGGFLAAGIPIVGAIASIAGGLASLLGFSHLIDLDATVVNVVTVLGLGLCIDYGLLMVSRFRDEVRAVHGTRPDDLTRAETAEALARTMSTAGRTVLFSGVTVGISLGGLLLFEAAILSGTGAAGLSVVAIALLVALTLVPALLALGARRLARPGVLNGLPLVRRLGDVAPEEGFFSRLARRVQRRPWWVVVGVLTVLVVLALPVLGLTLRSSAEDLLPADHPQRQFYAGLRTDFPFSVPPAITVVTEGSDESVGEALEAWSDDVVEGVDGVASVDPPVVLGDVTYVGVRLDSTDPGGPEAAEVVRDLRADRPDEIDVLVTGQAAGLVDFAASMARSAPQAVAVVVLATFVLLFLMTGSILIPLKALLLNVVSLGASLGVVVWGFQEGNLAGLLDFTAPGGIETVIPPLVLALGFGLAMDYEVFLLSRIKELRDTGLDNDSCVVAGLQRSGRIITCAGLVIVVVFAGFVAGDMLVIKETGVALAVAVVIDATLVRMLLVPAAMTLLGEWNWWAPGPLRRLHDRIGVNH